MRSVGEHLNLCLLAAEPLPELAVPLEDAVDCILAADVVAEVALPEASLAGGDGYAVSAPSVANAPVALPVTGEIVAGETAWTRLVPGTAIRIASGAPLPPGADTVIPAESTDMGISTVDVQKPYPEGAMVVPRGIDVLPGQVLLNAGERLDAKKIALLSALGMGRVQVHPRVRVVVITIGDEIG